jgi:hypothetical protein
MVGEELRSRRVETSFEWESIVFRRPRYASECFKIDMLQALGLAHVTLRFFVERNGGTIYISW